jgi:oxygen-independent coproporphyrinogen-3 oxidase
MKSVYIHIPFCNTICSYCDFCKLQYNKEWVLKYLKSLTDEINSFYKDEQVRTLYIGGGTPSALDIDELTLLFEIISMLDLSEVEEFTIECNIESLTKEKLILFKKNKVNRLSIGIQTFNHEYLRLLNRNHTKEQVFEMIEDAKAIGFNNINVDLIYALPDQTMEMLKEDLNKFLQLNVQHISCCSLMIEPNTKLHVDRVKNIDEDLDYEMYSYIENMLISSGFTHYEISNYAVEGYESKHNLVYWNNEYYYGFGLGASGYLEGYRYDNTKSLNSYLNGQFVANVTKIDDNDKLKYELMLGFRKIKGINKEEFYNKYNINLKDLLNIRKLLDQGKLEEDSENIYISKEWIYKSNEILVDLL